MREKGVNVAQSKIVADFLSEAFGFTQTGHHLLEVLQRHQRLSEFERDVYALRDCVDGGYTAM